MEENTQKRILEKYQALFPLIPIVNQYHIKKF